MSLIGKIAGAAIGGLCGGLPFSVIGAVIGHFIVDSGSDTHISPCSYNSPRNYYDDYDFDYVDEPGWIAPHNGRCYDSSNDYPRCADGSPDMRYAENYTHADDDFQF